jgi:hypothetical protein
MALALKSPLRDPQPPKGGLPSCEQIDGKAPFRGLGVFLVCSELLCNLSYGVEVCKGARQTWYDQIGSRC